MNFNKNIVLKYFSLMLLCVLLLFPTISGGIFPADNVYSYINQQEFNIDDRGVIQLLISSNRAELKKRVEKNIFESPIRNFVLKQTGEIVWFLQTNLKYVDFQIFDTEVFYGLEGELFPKYSNCYSQYETPKITGVFDDHDILFLIIPLKQEIEKDRMLNYKKKYAICKKNKIIYEEFIKINKSENKLHTNIYSLLDKDARYFMKGDTHWNNYSVNLVFKDIVEQIYDSSDIQIIKNGFIFKTNFVIKRLGLIDLVEKEEQYLLDYQTSIKKKVLIVHDSFFEEEYVDREYIEEFFQTDYIRWESILEMSTDQVNELFQNFDNIIIESGADLFFSTRILLFQK